MSMQMDRIDIDVKEETGIVLIGNPGHVLPRIRLRPSIAMFWRQRCGAISEVLSLVAVCFMNSGCETHATEVDKVSSVPFTSCGRTGVLQYATAGDDVLVVVITASTKGEHVIGRLAFKSTPKGMEGVAGPSRAWIEAPDGSSQSVPGPFRIVEFVDGQSRFSECRIANHELVAYLKREESKYSLDDISEFVDQAHEGEGHRGQSLNSE